MSLQRRVIATAGFFVLLISQAADAQVTWTSDSRSIRREQDTVPTQLGLSSGYTSSHSDTTTNGPTDFSRWTVAGTEDSQFLPFDGTYFHFVASGTMPSSQFNGNLITQYSYGSIDIDETFTNSAPVTFVWQPTVTAPVNELGSFELFRGSTVYAGLTPFSSVTATLPAGTWKLAGGALTTMSGPAMQTFAFDFALTPEPAALTLAPLVVLILRRTRAQRRVN